MRVEDIREGEIEEMREVFGACGDDFGDLTGLVQRGHHAPWALRRHAMYEQMVDEPGWPQRAYMRSVPWSIAYPDEPPCDEGEEQVIWEDCHRETPGAVPVTVLRFSTAAPVRPLLPMVR